MDPARTPAMLLCTSCELLVPLDDVFVAHSDGQRCLCLRCYQGHTGAGQSSPGAALVAEVNETVVAELAPVYHVTYEEWERW